MKESCENCYFLKKDLSGQFCFNYGSCIESIKSCLTGPLVKLPKTGTELSQLIKVVEREWRKEGEGVQPGYNYNMPLDSIK